MARQDPHSYADLAQARVTHARFLLDVDFDSRRTNGTTRLVFAQPAGGPLDLDTRGLEIRFVRSGSADLQHQLIPPGLHHLGRCRLAGAVEQSDRIPGVHPHHPQSMVRALATQGDSTRAQLGHEQADGQPTPPRPRSGAIAR